MTTHHERDQETELDYRGARFYDSDIGRFLSLDPLAVDFPQLSDYIYAADNPIFFTDPTGLAPEGWSQANIDLANLYGTFGHGSDWIPDGKGNLIAEEGDNAQTLADYQGTSYNQALNLLKANGYTTTRKGKVDVLNLKVGDKVSVGNYSWSAGESNSNSTLFPHYREFTGFAPNGVWVRSINGVFGTPVGGLAISLGIVDDAKGIGLIGSFEIAHGFDLSGGVEMIHHFSTTEQDIFMEDITGEGRTNNYGAFIFDAIEGGNHIGSDYNMYSRESNIRAIGGGVSVGLPVSYTRQAGVTGVLRITGRD